MHSACRGCWSGGSRTVRLKVFAVDAMSAEISRTVVEIPRVPYCFEKA
jgi:hypothetical protein